MPFYEVVVELGTLVIHVEADNEDQASEDAIEQLNSTHWQSDVDLEVGEVNILKD